MILFFFECFLPFFDNLFDKKRFSCNQSFMSVEVKTSDGNGDFQLLICIKHHVHLLHNNDSGDTYTIIRSRI